MLVGDPGRLRQVVVNLVGNAIKFTKQGEVVIRVEAEASNRDSVSLHFSVEDTGMGIPREKQQSIFDAFSQADGSTTRRYGGTGLGLSISSRLVEMMNGHIWVESEVGRGSTFHFTATFGVGEKNAVAPVKAELETLRDLPVLVVDDKATNRHILERMLAKWRMRPVAVDGGQAALDELEQALTTKEPSPILLVDTLMPGMDGFGLVERIRERPELAMTTVIMLTSDQRRGDRARSRELGVSSYLAKPIKESSLLEAMLTAVAKHPADNPQNAQEEPSRHLDTSDRNLHILLAEDNLVNQRLAVRFLEKRGHTVVLANDGKQALATLETDRFDLVLMDVQMPEMNGFEATALIRDKEKSTGNHIPIIAMTASAMEGDRERCLEAGMDEYVSKPLDREKLFEVVERPIGSATEGETVAHQTYDEPLDRAKLLSRVDGDKTLLAEIIRLFLGEAPEMLSAIRGSIGRGDGQALERAAHKLKGSLGNLEARAASEEALRLETLARSRDWGRRQRSVRVLGEPDGAPQTGPGSNRKE